MKKAQQERRGQLVREITERAVELTKFRGFEPRNCRIDFEQSVSRKCVPGELHAQATPGNKARLTVRLSWTVDPDRIPSSGETDEFVP